MLFLLDTNAFSDLMIEHPKARARVANLPLTDEIITCAIVRGEILHDIELLQPGRRRSDLDQKAQRLFASLNCHAVPSLAGDHYAVVKLACKRGGVVLNENDLWIAATTAALGAILVTRDRDFSRVPGLTIEDWTV